MARICLKLPYQGSLTTIVGRNFSFSNHLALVYLIPSLVPHAEQVLGFEAGPGRGSQGRQRSWNHSEYPGHSAPASRKCPGTRPSFDNKKAHSSKLWNWAAKRPECACIFKKVDHCKHTALVREDRVIKVICRGLIFNLTFRVLIGLNSVGWKNSALFRENAQCSSPLSGQPPHGDPGSRWRTVLGCSRKDLHVERRHLLNTFKTSTQGLWKDLASQGLTGER